MYVYMHIEIHMCIRFVWNYVLIHSLILDAECSHMSLRPLRGCKSCTPLCGIPSIPQRTSLLRVIGFLEVGFTLLASMVFNIDLNLGFARFLSHFIISQPYSRTHETEAGLCYTKFLSSNRTCVFPIYRVKWKSSLLLNHILIVDISYTTWRKSTNVMPLSSSSSSSATLLYMHLAQHCLPRLQSLCHCTLHIWQYPPYPPPFPLFS